MPTAENIKILFDVFYNYEHPEKETNSPASLEILRLFINGEAVPKKLQNFILKSYQDQIENDCWSDLEDKDYV